jgi:hypothetical protein
VTRSLNRFWSSRWLPPKLRESGCFSGALELAKEVEQDVPQGLWRLSSDEVAGSGYSTDEGMGHELPEPDDVAVECDGARRALYE